MSTDSPLLTYSPLIDAKGKVSGVHFRIHADGVKPAAAAAALGALADVWPGTDVVTLADFVGYDSSKWVEGWAPIGNTYYVADTALATMAPGYRALGPLAPKLCIRSTNVPAVVAPTVGYFGATAATVGEFAAIPSQHRRFPLVVTGIADPREYSAAVNSGAVLAGGWSFLKRPTVSTDKRLGTVQTVLQLMEMVDRDEDIADIADVLKRDAVLSYKLVSLANSAAMGLAVEVKSIQHAISMLGMSRMRHWLAVLLLHCGGNDTPPALMHAAFTRAAFLEAVGKSLDLESGHDDLFLCGAFSLLDKILGLPIKEILDKVSVSEAITDALLHRTGPYAELLELAESVEKDDDASLRRVVDDLALYNQVVNRSLLGAIRTASSLTAG